MNKFKIVISFAIGIFISGIGLYIALVKVPFRDLGIYLATINYWWSFPTILLILISFLFRALRWQLILEPIQKVNFWQAYHPLMIGFMINCILPGRVGELARPAILKQKENVSFSSGLATLTVERVFDLIILLILFAAVLMTIEIDPNLSIPFGKYTLNKFTLEQIGRKMVFICIILISGMIFISIQKTKNLMNSLILNLPKRIIPNMKFRTFVINKIATPLTRIIDHFASGFDLMKSPSKSLYCFALSILIWILNVATYYIFSLGCPGVNISILQTTAMMVIICFFIALPSAPGYWGLWEAGGKFGLLLFGVQGEVAMGYTLTNHAIQLFPVIIFGFISAFISGINIMQVSYHKSAPQEVA